MDAAITTLGAAAGAEALKAWGSYVIVLMLLAVWVWLAERRNRLKDQELEKLRGAMDRLQDLRVTDAREMIRVAESGTRTIAARTEGDSAQQELLRALVSMLADPKQQANLTPALTALRSP